MAKAIYLHQNTSNSTRLWTASLSPEEPQADPLKELMRQWGTESSRGNDFKTGALQKGKPHPAWAWAHSWEIGRCDGWYNNGGVPADCSCFLQEVRGEGKWKINVLEGGKENISGKAATACWVPIWDSWWDFQGRPVSAGVCAGQAWSGMAVMIAQGQGVAKQKQWKGRGKG